jgi:hypothetical protein
MVIKLKKIILFLLLFLTFDQSDIFCAFKRIDEDNKIIFAKDGEQYIWEKTTDGYSLNHIKNYSQEKFLLEYLVSLDLEAFCKTLEKFILKHISFHDFSKKNTSQDLPFFILGLLSLLGEEYSVEADKLGTSSQIGENIFYSFIVKKGGETFLTIRTKTVKEESFFVEDQREFLNEFDQELTVNIVSSGKNIFYKYNSFSGSENSENKINLFESPREFLRSLDQQYINNYFNNKDNKINLKFSSERDFHNFVMGLLANTKQLTYLSSNREAGIGRPDIVFKTNKNREKYILEFKYGTKKNIKDANRQIMDKIYIGTGSLVGYESEDVYGQAFVLDQDTRDIYAGTMFKLDKDVSKNKREKRKKNKN